MALFAAHRIFHSADRVLNFARNLVGLAFSFQLLVAARGFFHGTLGLLCRTVDPCSMGLSTAVTPASTFSSRWPEVRWGARVFNFEQTSRGRRTYTSAQVVIRADARGHGYIQGE
jgi:hypothetical protein